MRQDSTRGAASQAWLRQHGLACAVFICSMLLFEFCWGGSFYHDANHLGHDFTLAGIGLLEGKYWLISNGLAGLFDPPWFTPAWCAGSVLYADPQSAYYSPLQWFAFLVDPFEAAHWDALLFAAVAFWGSYALSQRIFRWDAASSTVFAVLGIANALMPLHSAVGEVGYQPLYLWTLLALALCWPSGRILPRSALWPGLAVALVLTGWLQFGYGGMLVPTFLATLLMCLALTIYGRADLWNIIARCAVGGVLAILLNISKLYESVSLLHNFPRNFYTMPGFPSLRDALIAVPSTLIEPSQWMYSFGERHLVDVRFTVLPHEWAMNFGLGALGVALLSLLAARLSKGGLGKLPLPPLDTSRMLAVLGCILIAAIPFLLLWNDGGLRTLIKQVPILNSTTWPMRWIVILLPLAQLLLAWPLRRFVQARGGKVVWPAILAFVLIWLGPLTDPQDYYRDAGMQSYSPQPVLRAFESAKTHGVAPIVSVNANPDAMERGSRNDTMMHGVSQGYCYNPLYGYRLESFPQVERLKTGPALSVDEHGQSLIYNPACLVHPQENDCQPGDGFRMDDPQQALWARQFLDRRPYAWQRPPLGLALARVSQLTFWSIVALLLFAAGRVLKLAVRPHAEIQR